MVRTNTKFTTCLIVKIISFILLVMLLATGYLSGAEVKHETTGQAQTLLSKGEKMENKIKIATPDKKFIYGTLNYNQPKPKKMIIFVHGLFDSEKSHLMINASKFFNNKGFATFRFNLYYYMPDARHFSECTLTQHGKDLDTVINYFRGKYEFIYVVGHSYGSFTVLLSKREGLNAVSLWELSSFISHPPTYFEYNPEIKKYTLNMGYDVIVEKKFIDDIKHQPNELDLIGKVKCPVQIIYASNPGSGLEQSSKRYYENIQSGDKDILSVNGASHSFPESGVDKVLFNGTLNWFNRF